MFLQLNILYGQKAAHRQVFEKIEGALRDNRDRISRKFYKGRKIFRTGPAAYGIYAN